MVVEAHKVLKKRRQKHKSHPDEPFQPAEDRDYPGTRPTVIDIFNFLSDKEEDYSTVIKEIGEAAKKSRPSEDVSRSKSCSDILAAGIQTLDHSPRQRRRLSISEIFIRPKSALDNTEEGQPLIQDSNGEPPSVECQSKDIMEDKDGCASDSEDDCGITFGPIINTKEEESVPCPDGGLTRFTISKVVEGGLKEDKDGKG